MPVTRAFPTVAKKDEANTFSEKQTFSGEIEVDGALNHDGTTVGFFGVSPATQSAHIIDPSGGITVDPQARTAINAILVVLETKGLTASV